MSVWSESLTWHTFIIYYVLHIYLIITAINITLFWLSMFFINFYVIIYDAMITLQQIKAARALLDWDQKGVRTNRTFPDCYC